MQPTNPKIFTLWYFTEKVQRPLLNRKQFPRRNFSFAISEPSPQRSQPAQKEGMSTRITFLSVGTH